MYKCFVFCNFPDEIEIERKKNWQQAADHRGGYEECLQCRISRCREIPAIEPGIHDDYGEQYREEVNVEILSGEDSDEVRFEFVEDVLHGEFILTHILL